MTQCYYSTTHGQWPNDQGEKTKTYYHLLESVIFVMGRLLILRESRPPVVPLAYFCFLKTYQEHYASHYKSVADNLDATFFSDII